MAAGTGPTVAPEIRPLLTASSDAWRLIIIGDQFQPTQRDAFFAYAQAFANHMVEQAPFNEPNLRSRIQLYACFTPTTAAGMFKCKKEAERRIYGQPDLVRKYIKRHRNAQPVLKLRANDLVLVLMNFVERGGAGESGGDNIAWTTPIPWLAPDQTVIEPWTDVGLHELGHAFDLDDEYERAWPGAPHVPAKANICASADPAQAPWKALFDHLPPVTLRSADRSFGSADPDWPTAAEITAYGGVKAGMFQGARYSSTQFWRAALRCRMRATREPFCQACQAVIRTSILTNA